MDATGKDYSGQSDADRRRDRFGASLFPPENATGNYVKVVQRIPVRIDFTDLANEDPNHELRPGFRSSPRSGEVRKQLSSQLIENSPEWSPLSQRSSGAR